MKTRNLKLKGTKLATISLLLLMFLLSSVTLAQAPVAGIFYQQFMGNGGLFVGGKDIAKVTFVLTARNEYGDEVNFRKSITFYGPYLAHCKYGFRMPNYYLGRYPMANISKVIIYYYDKSVVSYGKKQSEAMSVQYLELIGQGY